MSKIKYQYFLWIFFYLFIFAFLWHNSLSYLDPDLGWHLRTGQEIIAQKQVPHANTLNYPLLGTNWVDHEWLFDVILYKSYILFSYAGLTTIFVLLVILALIVLAYFTKKYYLQGRNSTFLIMFFQFFGIAAMAPHLGIRMQEITLLFLTLLLLIIFKFSKQKKLSTLFWLWPLFILWVNMHGSFLIGLFTIWFWLGIKIGEHLLKRIPKIQDYFEINLITPIKLIKITAILTIAQALTLLNPYGLGLYSFLKDYGNTFYMSKISEWLPFYTIPIQYMQFFYLATALSVLLAWLFQTYFTKKKSRERLNLWPGLLLLVFFLLSLKSKRHFSLFWLLSFPAIVSFLYTYLNVPESWKKIFSSRIIKFYVISAFILASMSLFVSSQRSIDPFQNSNYCDLYPCAAVNFLNSEHLNDLRLFNNYGWGGYLIWTRPGKQLFIDGRMPQYNYQGRSFLEEYMDFYDADLAEQKLSEHKIELVLLRIYPKIRLNWFEKYILLINEENLNKGEDGLKKYLDNSNEWQNIYQDKISLIYQKN